MNTSCRVVFACLATCIVGKQLRTSCVEEFRPLRSRSPPPSPNTVSLVCLSESRTHLQSRVTRPLQTDSARFPSHFHDPSPALGYKPHTGAIRSERIVLYAVLLPHSRCSSWISLLYWLFSSYTCFRRPVAQFKLDKSQDYSSTSASVISAPISL